MTYINLVDVPLRKIAKQVRMISADCGGDNVYVYLVRGVIEVTRRFKQNDDFVGTYNSTTIDTVIVHDLIEAAWCELDHVQKVTA